MVFPFRFILNFSECITYISASMPTPWAVTGPNRQLASVVCPWTCLTYLHYGINLDRNQELKQHPPFAIALCIFNYSKVGHVSLAGTTMSKNFNFQFIFRAAFLKAGLIKAN